MRAPAISQQEAAQILADRIAGWRAPEQRQPDQQRQSGDWREHLWADRPASSSHQNRHQRGGGPAA